MQQISIEKSAPREFVTAWKSQGPPDLTVILPDWEHVVLEYCLGRSIPRARTRGEVDAVRDRSGRLRVWLFVLRDYRLASADEEMTTWLLSQGDTRPVAGTDPFVVTEVLLY